MSVTLESVTMTRTYFVAQTYSLGKNGCVSRLHPLSMYTHPRAVPQAIVLNRVTVGGHNSLQKIFFVMENGFFWSEKRRTISQFTRVLKYLNLQLFLLFALLLLKFEIQV